MHHGRKRITCVLTGLGLTASLGLVSSTPAAAEPSIDSVTARVDTLYREAEVASERHHDAEIELDGLQQDLASLKADEARQDRRLERVREQVRDSVQRELRGQDVSAVGQVVVSDDPSAFLSQMSTMSAYQQLQQGLFSDYATEQKALGMRSAATQRRADQVASVEKRLAEQQATVDDKLAEAKSLLARLKEEERQRIAAEQAREREAAERRAAEQAAEQAAAADQTTERERTPVSRSAASAPEAAAPASGRASAAVSYALAQVGKAYVYGAAGPSAFDCSGLTMQAWGAAGVGLPHSSSAQMSSGASVSSSALQPGDLVFYYSPVSHVGIYVGDGTIVHAANPGSGVAVAPVFSMPFSGAVRPG